ncbi:methyltransferase domain-containing protein [Streptomyces profundus]|nr:methyltransferase domain-containing protein [Streptomyces sp. MA3_2.13]
MAESGYWPERSPWIREAAWSLPRHDFAADRLWFWDGYAYRSVDRGADPDRWAAQVYAGPHDAAITQITEGRPSSSLSAPAVVADMLDSLLAEPGHRILELGAGTGWNAALLAHRVGPGRVTSVEVDGELAATARNRLARAGVRATVEVGDGTAGWPGGAPFDRLIVSSWATLDGPKATAHTGGPRDLAAELDHAWTHWTERGAPDIYDFGMTVERDTGQFIWCDDPSTGPYWPATG